MTEREQLEQASPVPLTRVVVPDLWQQEAVTALREGKDVVVQAPTGKGINQPGYDHGHTEGVLPRAFTPNKSIETLATQSPQNSSHMAMGTTAHDVEDFLQLLHNDPTLKQKAQSFYHGRRPLGQVGDRAFLDLSVLPVGFPQQGTRGRVSVGDGFDIHGYL